MPAACLAVLGMLVLLTQGTFAEVATHDPSGCGNLCNMCTGDGRCLMCPEGLAPNNRGKCQRVATPCGTGCQTCAGARRTKCTRCLFGYYKEGSKCIPWKPNEKNCNKYCGICIDGDMCLYCQDGSGATLWRGRCIKNLRKLGA